MPASAPPFDHVVNVLQRKPWVFSQFNCTIAAISPPRNYFSIGSASTTRQNQLSAELRCLGEVSFNLQLEELATCLISSRGSQILVLGITNTTSGGQFPRGFLGGKRDKIPSPCCNASLGRSGGGGLFQPPRSRGTLQPSSLELAFRKPRFVQHWSTGCARLKGSAAQSSDRVMWAGAYGGQRCAIPAFLARRWFIAQSAWLK